jgi:hypothetical protein
MKLRMDYLMKEIYKQTEKIQNEENCDLLELVYLFYDGFDYRH